tara:strand:+ start:1732 stop:1917 length:186 start_codon:yes stop_codon:yes gene_type:complete
MTQPLLLELLIVLSTVDADGYKSWLALGSEEVGWYVAGEVALDWMVTSLVKVERTTSWLEC